MPDLSAEHLLAPNQEDQRLLLLSTVLGIGSPLRAALSLLTDTLSAALGLPAVLVSLVDVESQHFLAQTGMPNWAREGMPISHSFCRLVAAHGEALVIPDSRADDRVNANPAIVDLSVAAYAGEPIVVSGHTLGSLCAIDAKPRKWQAHELSSLRTAADLVQFLITARLKNQLALLDERAETSARERAHNDALHAIEASNAEHDRVEELSRRFQSALMPKPTAPENLSVEVLYEPGSERLLVGGDFADTMVTGPTGHELSFVLGDVTGHGPEAAALAISLRATWHALERAGMDLPQIAAELDRQANTDGLFATVLIGRIFGDKLHVLSAGHPRPIVSDGASARELAIPTGLILGTGSVYRWRASHHQLRGETLLAYTDGLIEGFVNGTRERLGVERLLAMIARVGPNPRQLCNEATRHNRGPLADDVAILRIRPI